MRTNPVARRIGVALTIAATVAMAACGTQAVPGGSPTPTGLPTTSESPVTPTPRETESPTPTGGPVADQPTWDNAPAPDDMPEVGESWAVADEYEGWGQGTLTPCQSGEIAAQTVLIRELKDANGWTMLTATLGFASVEEASAALEEISGWYSSCEEYQGDNFGDVSLWEAPGEIPISDELDGVADVVQLTGATVALVEEGNDEGLITNGVMVQVDDRLVWVVADGMGMDQNCGLNDDEPGGQCYAFGIANDVGLRLAG